MSESLDYGEYLKRVAEQRERDKDRFLGRDSHPEADAYSMVDGRSVSVPYMHIELNAEGLPSVVGLRGNRTQRLTLRRAMNWLDLYVDLGERGETLLETIRQRELEFRDSQARWKAERDAYEAARPFRCEVWRHCGGFKTARGLAMHTARTHKGEEG
jgi:hypothetical protein